MIMQAVQDLASVSRRYGADLDFVFLGGGNTSFKTADTLFIKPSGVALAEIQPEQFVRMDRQALARIFATELPADVWEKEAAVKALMEAAVRPLGSGRASVEAPVHDVIEYPFVVHLHPPMVNGLTCAVDGRKACAQLFPEALWLDYCNPGATLSLVVKQALDQAKARTGSVPKVMFLQNHGVFVAAETLAEIEAQYGRIMAVLRDAYAKAGVCTALQTGALDVEFMLARAPRVRTLLGGASRAVVAVGDPFEPAHGPLSPDHIVYAKSSALECTGAASDLDEFQAKRGYPPKIIAKAGQAVFCVGETLKDARAALTAARDAARVQQLTTAFGGPNYLTPEQYGFIENWEVESYRRKVSATGGGAGRLQNRVCVVTGGAQGFGLGIAKGLAAQGGIVVVADLNREGAEQAAAEINAACGPHRALAVAVDIADEESVAGMVRETVRQCGGIDLFVANAGVLKAGSVKTMAKAEWDLVTSVNYTGYFLCVKHASAVMAAQNVDGKGPWTDIVQINSKSGLEGSNRNGAYAGSKFGTIGLTQSFAKELIEDRIKVNSICPGNYFDGPLWSDPKNGLFVQYLDTGKVPGAKTIAEVRAAYEAKVPMGRGCLPEDVVKAILYCVEQDYETGQAMPVTGGQIMLK
jgi:NAD(P)-dependent dehydrogenase (short-subunit alcohol dehydrogenase family)/rhamnose utilization protein RhaD (predicted bifunctional aldolase and dehydrogenase)